jgi:hypothetical protein
MGIRYLGFCSSGWMSPASIVHQIRAASKLERDARVHIGHKQTAIAQNCGKDLPEINLLA